jgi:hypothetical protein
LQLDEVLEEVKRLRTCHDDKEKEALSLRRALERLRLEKDDESAALATDKAYICKLEAKVAAQATSKALFSTGCSFATISPPDVWSQLILLLRTSLFI